MQKAKNDTYKPKNDHDVDIAHMNATRLVTFLVLVLPVGFLTMRGLAVDFLFCSGGARFNFLLWTILIMTPSALFLVLKIVLAILDDPTRFKVTSLSIILTTILFAIPLGIFWFTPCPAW